MRHLKILLTSHTLFEKLQVFSATNKQKTKNIPVVMLRVPFTPFFLSVSPLPELILSPHPPMQRAGNVDRVGPPLVMDFWLHGSPLLLPNGEDSRPEHPSLTFQF